MHNFDPDRMSVGRFTDFIRAVFGSHSGHPSDVRHPIPTHYGCPLDIRISKKTSVGRPLDEAVLCGKLFGDVSAYVCTALF